MNKTVAIILLALTATVAHAGAPKPVIGGVHILKNDGGLNAFTAVMLAESMNRRGVTGVVVDRCQSSCAIIWNLLNKKCWVGNEPTIFKQHARISTGEKVNVYSRSGHYWIKLGGRNGRAQVPRDEWITWTAKMSQKCTNTKGAGYE